jgi:oligopeptide transport system substrate-binding protein
MPFGPRNLIAWLALAALGGATFWALSFKEEPPADFTFVNPSEIKSVDPAMVTGQVEGRIIEAIFEGLTMSDPKTLAPVPGVAESWSPSPEGRTYTFHLRKNAKWTNGEPVTAQDFLWSHRRMLDPTTASEYAYQLWYVKNAKKYTTGEVAVGDRVEVELNERPPGALPFARGQLLRGTLISVEPPFSDTPPAEGEKPPDRTYTVEINGTRRKFQPGSGPNGCKQVLLDFDQVGCKDTDDHTYEMTLENPTPYFVSLTTMYPLYAINPRCFERYGFPDWTKPENIVTNGPYRLSERRIRERTRLVKSENYWDRENVKLNTIDALVVESDTTGLNLYLTGHADWVQNVPATIVKQLIEGYPDDFRPMPEFILYFYRFNTTRPPLNKALVRKALALAVNKREIVEGVTRAGEVPARSLVPPVIKQYPPFEDYKSPLTGEFNPEEARRLLAQAGYPGGRGFPKISILFNSDETHQKIAELIQRQWKETLGIDAEPQNQEWNAYQAAERNQEYWVDRAGWIGDYVDPNTFLDMWLTGGGNNRTGWGDPRYDDLIHKAAQESDPKKRAAMLQDAEAILMDELPIIPIYFNVDKNMVRPYVRGFYRNVLDDHPLKFVSIDAAAKQRFLAAKGRR